MRFGRTFKVIFALLLVGVVTASSIYAYNRAKAKRLVFHPADYSMTQVMYDENGNGIQLIERSGSPGKARLTYHYLQSGKKYVRVYNEKGEVKSNDPTPNPKIKAWFDDAMLSAEVWPRVPGFVRQDTYLGEPVFVIIDAQGNESWYNPAYGGQPLKSIFTTPGGGKRITETVRISHNRQDPSSFELKPEEITKDATK